MTAYAAEQKLMLGVSGFRFRPFSDLPRRISKDVLASTNATVFGQSGVDAAGDIQDSRSVTCRTSASRFVLIPSPLFSNSRNIG